MCTPPLFEYTSGSQQEFAHTASWSQHPALVLLSVHLKHSPTMLGVWLLGSIQSTYHLTSWDLLTQPACLGMVPAFLTTRSKTAVDDSILIIGDSSFTPEPCSVMSHSLLFAICHYISCKQSHTAAGAIANISYIFQTEPESQVLFLLGNVAYLFQNLVAKQPPTQPGYNGM